MAIVSRASAAVLVIVTVAVAQAPRPHGKPSMTRIAPAPDVPSAVSSVHPDWRFAHPDASLLVSVRVGALLESEVMLGLPDQLVRSGVPGITQAQVDRVWDLFAGIEWIAVSIAQSGRSRPAAGLILLTGRFEDNPLLSLLRQSAAKLSAVSVSPNAVLLGDGRDLEAAVRRMSAYAPVNELVQAASRDSESHDIWLGGTVDVLTAAVGDQVPELQNIIRDIAGVSAGMTLQDDAAMEITVTATSAAAAHRLADRIRLVKIAQNVTIDQEGEEIRVRVTGDAERLSTDLASLAPFMRSPTPAPVQAAEPPSGRNTILIHGLDEGPREILVK